MPVRLYTASEVTAILKRLAVVEREEVAAKAGHGPARDKSMATSEALSQYAGNWQVWMPRELSPQP